MATHQDSAPASRPLLCPSAQPDWDGSVAFGVIGGTAAEPRMAHFAEPQPVTPALLARTAPVNPTEVFRFAAPCAGAACRHFDGARCGLAGRIVQRLPMVTDTLPACRIRPQCRWFQQEGRDACRRCPQIVTESYDPPAQFRRAVDPAGP